MEPNKQSTSPPTNNETGFYEPSTPIDTETPIVEGAPNRSIKWQASEFIHHDKGIGWGVGLVVVVVILVAVALLFQAWTFALLLVVMSVYFGMVAFRQPRNVEYELDDNGLRVGEQYFKLSEFRGFGIVPEGSIFSVVLIPVKRFSPAMTIYFAEEDGEEIIDILGAHIPAQEMHPNLIDAFMRRLRF